MEIKNENPLKYDIGEVCKCYFTEINKNADDKVSQQINKCQSFCRVKAINHDDTKCYTVELFDAEHTVKKLPGRCLRKVKLVAYEYEQATKTLGRIIESNDTVGNRRLSMVVATVEDGMDGDEMEVNGMPSSEMANSFHFVDTHAPYCNIVMLKADEAFGAEPTEE